MLSDVVGKGFWESHRRVQRGVTELVEAGGRGSGKSSFLSIELLLLLLKNPGCHAVAVRKVANTLRTSVFAQLQWAAEALGLGERFRCSLSPLEMEYEPTGQKILFFGMDDPGKLKSIKVSRGYIGICWFEELDQFTAEEVRSVEQSLFRGGPVAVSLKSFNPPPVPAHWVNTMEEKPGRFLHRSTYLQMPPGWLGQRFLDDAEHLKRVNPEAYKNEYLGQCVGVGQAVFGNLRLETISEGQIAAFDYVTAGVDWGWWPDPWAFNRVHYDSHRRILYIFDELTRLRCPNRDTAALAAGKIRGETVFADAAEPKSIADYRSFGIDCRAAVKGPGSVGASVKWLQSLDGIVIDPARCPDTAREFARWCYEEGGLPDRDNHHIDAVRYAVSRVWTRRGS